MSYINGVSIEGASLTKMLSDKLYAISGEGIFRRTKDLLDIYIMSYISEYRAKDVIEIWNHTERIPGDFSVFKNEKGRIRDAYIKMKGIENKPDFDEMYERVSCFILPFCEIEDIADVIWQKAEWRQ